MLGRSFLLLLIALFVTVTVLLAPLARAADQDDVDEYLDIDEEDGPGSEPEDDGKVVTLTSENFEKVIKDNKNVLVEFYAPWCGHCQSLAPEYARASLTLVETAPDVVLAKVDATEESSLAEQYGVQGFPTLFWFHDGKESEYSGGREEPDIVRWVMKKVGPAAKTVSTVEELTEVEAGGDVTLVGYFSDVTGTSAALTAFTEACRNLDTIACAQTSVAAVATAAGVSKESVAVVTKFTPEEKRETVAFTGKMEEEEITNFATAESLPAVVPFVGEYTERIFSQGVSHHMLFVASKDLLKADSPAFAAFTKVAEKLKSKRDFIFVAVDSDEEEAEPVVQFFEVEGEELPILFGFQMEPGQKKFRFTETFDEKSLEAFAAGILDGSVQPQLKSEETPEEGDDVDGHVQIVVGKSFDDIVKDSKKDVLLEIYAPWCGHCKNLEPIYKKLATRFKDIDSVVIAKMDGTSNEHAEVNVQGFPYIAFYPAKEGAEAVQYEGERTLKAMTKFIKEYAMVPYELKKKPTAEDSSSTDESKDEL